jgi:hypothetical protein
MIGAMIEPLLRLVDVVLALFRQKVFVFVEVTANTDKPYMLTVKNKSGFEVLIDHLKVCPDGFPHPRGGFNLGTSGLFSDKKLQPGERIRLALSLQDVGDEPTRRFIVYYKTLILGYRVPRKERSYEHTFEKEKHSLTYALMPLTGHHQTKDGE